MNTNTIAGRSLREIALYALAYLLWLATTLASIVAVLEIRLAVNTVCVLGRVDTYTLGVINQVCLLLVGFIAFVYVIYLEHYYREGVRLRCKPRPDESASLARVVPKGRVWEWLAGLGIDILARRFVWSFAIPLFLFFLSSTIVEMTLRAMETV